MEKKERFSAINVDKNQKIEVVCHLINGWSALFLIKKLISNIGIYGVILIIVGGLIYSIGTILYALGSKKKYMHSVFHFFCIAASICHYFAIYLFVLR